MRHHRLTIARASFVILVIMVPLAFGIGWAEHQRNVDVARIVAERRLALIASCERGNVVRSRLNEHIETTKEQADLLLDYMRLDTAGIDLPEKEAIVRLVRLYEQANAAEKLQIVNCNLIR